jgi:hypothetical protein
MKRNLIAYFLLAACMLLGHTNSYATPFSQTIDFYSLDNQGQPIGYLEIQDSFSYEFLLTGLTSQQYTLTNASLSLRHYGNSNTDDGEVWFSDTDTNNAAYIGRLSNSNTGQNWVTDTWTLSTAVLSLMKSKDPWELTIYLYDNTNGADKIKIDYSILSGNYDDTGNGSSGGGNAVPEPSCIFLLGTGLLGVAVALRRKLKK